MGFCPYSHNSWLETPILRSGLQLYQVATGRRKGKEEKIALDAISPLPFQRQNN